MQPTVPTSNGYIFKCDATVTKQRLNRFIYEISCNKLTIGGHMTDLTQIVVYKSCFDEFTISWCLKYFIERCYCLHLLQSKTRVHLL